MKEDTKKIIMKIISTTLAIAMAVPAVTVGTMGVSAQASYTADATNEKTLRMWYDEPAPDSDSGWENWSIPLGNGYMGANVFGLTETERVQITEVSLVDPYPYGVNSFAEVYIDFGHTYNNVTNYSRDLVLNTSTSKVKYDYDGATYTREYFTSYPDKVMVMKFDSSVSGKLDFTLRPTIPYLCEYRETEGDGKGKTGTVTAEGDTITLSGNMEYYDIDFEGQFKVIPTGGSMTANSDGTITVTGADSAVVIAAVGTNYVLNSTAFTASIKQKTEGNPHPHEKVTQYIADASSKSYEQLYSNHQTDYRNLFAGALVDLGGVAPDYTTDELLSHYKNGTYKNSPQELLYLEEVYFQFGRYLLICSSRKGTLPGNLQGIWNVYAKPAWTAGYWHNINVQMNYWPAFNTNLAELFESYADLNKAFRKAAENNADKYLTEIGASDIAETGTGENGWAVGTGVSPFGVEKPQALGHSGPGTGGLTTKLFWDYYDYTRSLEVLEETTYPTLLGMDKFLNKVLVEQDGKLLASPSASPEQCINGVYPNYYHTVGCMFDQQMIYENHADTIKAAEILGVTNETVETAKAQLKYLDPVAIGYSGHIKEYREENYYGEIGQYEHRHVSQLVGLYPGQSINSSTPAWLDAAKVSLKERGDGSSGWSYAHRVNLWARALEGNKAYDQFSKNLKNRTLTNLWSNHPPFQIDGNYGNTAGVAEMLLQSHEGYIAPLAALPDAWSVGSYRGLTARGNFEVGADWADGKATEFVITSNSGGECSVKYYNLALATVTDSDGTAVEFAADGDVITFNTEKGKTYTITDIPEYTKLADVEDLSLEYIGSGEIEFNWSENADAESYNLYMAKDNEPCYTLVKTGITGSSYTYSPENYASLDQCTFKLTAVNDGEESDGGTAVLLPAPDPESPKGYFTDDYLQISFKPNETVEHYNYYKKTEAGYELIATDTYSVICIDKADKGAEYAVSATANGRESDKITVEILEYETIDNVLLGKTVTLTSNNRWIHTSFPLSNGTDGDLKTRYAVQDTAGSYSIEIDIGEELPLNILNIYEFKPGEDTTRSNFTKAEVYSNGKYVTVFEDKPLNGGQSTFDLGGKVGSKIQLTFDDDDTNNKSASIYEITCSSEPETPGEKSELLALVKEADKVVTNEYITATANGFADVLASSKSVLLNATANSETTQTAVSNLQSALDTLEKNILYKKPVIASPTRSETSWAPEHLVDGNTSTRFAAYDNGTTVDVEIDLRGTYEIDYLTVLEFMRPDKLTRSGETTIYFYNDGEWTTVIDKQPLSDGSSPAFTKFETNGATASKIRYHFENVIADSNQRTTIFELQAAGTKIADAVIEKVILDVEASDIGGNESVNAGQVSVETSLVIDNIFTRTARKLSVKAENEFSGAYYFYKQTLAEDSSFGNNELYDWYSNSGTLRFYVKNESDQSVTVKPRFYYLSASSVTGLTKYVRMNSANGVTLPANSDWVEVRYSVNDLVGDNLGYIYKGSGTIFGGLYFDEFCKENGGNVYATAFEFHSEAITDPVSTDIERKYKKATQITGNNKGTANTGIERTYAANSDLPFFTNAVTYKATADNVETKILGVTAAYNITTDIADWAYNPDAEIRFWVKATNDCSFRLRMQLIGRDDKTYRNAFSTVSVKASDEWQEVRVKRSAFSTQPATALYNAALETQNFDAYISIDTVSGAFLNTGDTLQFGANFEIFTRKAYDKGDANRDGVVNLKDIVRLKKVAVAAEPSISDIASGDIDCNNTVSATDITYLRKKIMNGKWK